MAAETTASCPGFLTLFLALGTIDAMSTPDPVDELRQMYPPIMTTAHVAEMMHCTIGDVRDKVHSGELPAVRWGQQFRFFRDQVVGTLKPYQIGEELPQEEADADEGKGA